MGYRLQVWAAGALTALVLCVAGTYVENNPDTFGHLAQGRDIAERGGVPKLDPFSFWQATPQPWVNYEWLSDWVFWQAYAGAGIHGLMLLKWLALGLLGFLLPWLAYRYASAANQAHAAPHAAWLCSAAVMLQVAGVRFRLASRPHVMGITLAALTLWWLLKLSGLTREGADRKRAVLWLCALFVLHVLWVNWHGSNLFGPLLTVIHLAAFWKARDARVYLSLALLAQLVASCVSPYGPAILVDAIAHTMDPRFRALVPEWQAWTAKDPIYYLFALALHMALTVLSVRPLLNGPPAHRALLAMLVLLTLMAARSIRFYDSAFLLGALSLAVGLGSRFNAWPLAKLRSACVGAGVMVLATGDVTWAQLPPYSGVAVGRGDEDFPVQSARLLRQHRSAGPAPRLFAAVEDSWYVMFAAPNVRVLWDGRVPFYGADFVARMRMAYANPPAFEAMLNAYGVDTVLIKHSFGAHMAGHAALRGSAATSQWSRWHLVGIENFHALYMRAPAGAPITMPVFEQLHPGYNTEPLLAPGVDVAAVQQELLRVPQGDTTDVYRAWVHAMLGLRSLSRAGAQAGLRAPANATERETAKHSAALLAKVEARISDVPVIAAYAGLAALAACELNDAERAFTAANKDGGSREALLGSVELQLRRGDVRSVRASLATAKADPRAANDPWLAAIERDLANPPRCP